MTKTTKAAVDAEPVPMEPATDVVGQGSLVQQTGGLALLEMDPEAAVKIAERQAVARKQIIATALRNVCGLANFVDMGDGVIYVEGRAARAVLQWLGYRQANRTWEIAEDKVTKGLRWECTFDVVNGRGEVVYEAYGSRVADEGEEICKRETHFKSAAELNAWARAGVALCGWGGWTRADYEAHGVKIGTTVGRKAGSKGGVSRDEAGNLCFLFGPGIKGKAINDPSVTVKDLRWYLGVMRSTLADPSKSKLHASNQRYVDAIEEELEIRKHGGAP